jgi:hypothetical protein
MRTELKKRVIVLILTIDSIIAVLLFASCHGSVPAPTTEIPANSDLPASITETPANSDVPVPTTEIPGNTDVPVLLTDLSALIVCVNTATDNVSGDTGYWVKSASGEVVRSTDDAYADDDIQAAIGLGKYIIIDEGVYRLMTGIFLDDNMTITGRGMATTRLEAASNNISAIIIVNIVQQSGSGGFQGIRVMHGSTHITLENLLAENWRNEGIYFYNPPESAANTYSVVHACVSKDNGGHGFSSWWSHHIIWSDNYAENNGRANWGDSNGTIGGFYSHGASFQQYTGNSALGNNNGAGFWSSSATDSTYTGNIAEDNADSGFRMNGAQRTSVYGNISRDNNFCGVHVSNGGQGITIAANSITKNNRWGILITSGNNISITGNEISENGCNGINSDSTHLLVSGNFLYRNKGHSIWLNNTGDTYSTITGNEIVDPGYEAGGETDGINVAGSGNTITGNSVSFSDASWMRNCIRLESTANNNVVSGNTLHNQKNYLAIEDNGSNNIIVNNINQP